MIGYLFGFFMTIGAFVLKDTFILIPASICILAGSISFAGTEIKLGLNGLGNRNFEFTIEKKGEANGSSNECN